MSMETSPSEEDDEKIYFAYGSNLSVSQMAQRCPESRFLGRARLSGYSFQINDRGFANVIPSPNPSNFVDGLCYLLTAKDESRLDRSEGVPSAYQKRFLEVEFFAAKAFLSGRKVVHVKNHLRYLPEQDTIQPPKRRRYSDDSISYDEREIGRFSPLEVDKTVALVYISTNHTQSGLPWDEYINRMDQGIIEAIALGVPREPFERKLRPFLLRGRGVRIARGSGRKVGRSRAIPHNRQRLGWGHQPMGGTAGSSELPPGSFPPEEMEERGQREREMDRYQSEPTPGERERVGHNVIHPRIISRSPSRQEGPYRDG